MKYNLFSFFIAVGCGAFFCACSSKTTEVVYTNGIPGTLIADVTLNDSTWSKILDPSDVEVSIEGTAIKGLTDKNGRCTLLNVPPGIYNIFFKKIGFITQVYGQKEFVGNGTDEVSTTLVRITHKTTDFIIRYFDSTGVAPLTWKVLDTISTESVFGNFFFSDNPKISPYDTSSYRWATYDIFARGTSKFSVDGRDTPISLNSLLSAGFLHNEIIYCMLVASSQPGYNDIISGKYIFYDGLSPYTSRVLSIRLP